VSAVSIEEAVRQAGVLLRADGADLHLISFDSENAELRVAVDLSSSECADCVLPPDLLAVVISDVIHRDFGTPITVLVDDPRT